jgi:hypothetical protein
MLLACRTETATQQDSFRSLASPIGLESTLQEQIVPVLPERFTAAVTGGKETLILEAEEHAERALFDKRKKYAYASGGTGIACQGYDY